MAYSKAYFVQSLICLTTCVCFADAESVSLFMTGITIIWGRVTSFFLSSHLQGLVVYVGDAQGR